MKKIVFVTGTRADYGKLKSIILNFQKKKNFKTIVFATGMHNLKIFGNTFKEIKKDKIKNVHRFFNQVYGNDMPTIMAKTVIGFNKLVKKIKPDLIVVHGDRLETLACASVGSFQNIKVAHIEGGEVSGTVDELIRHAVSKLSHVHMVTNLKAKKRLVQMGENKNNIYIIGSPDIDIMTSKNLPKLSEVKKKYEIKYENYCMAIFHPVTTELGNIKKQVNIFIEAMMKTKKNYILIYPNNDDGSKLILNAYSKIKNNSKFRILPSMRFEHYLSLLKNSQLIIGNSSSGIIEAPYFGVPTINIGSRQNNRAKIKSIYNLNFNKNKIIDQINKIKKNNFKIKTSYFGKGKSFQKFINILKSKKFWNISSQKYFTDLN